MFASKKTISLEDKLAKATEVFRQALNGLTQLKEEIGANKASNQEKIAELVSDNTRLEALDKGLDDKLEVLKKLV